MIEFSPEAGDTLDRLLDELRGYVVKVTLSDGREFDAVLKDSHAFTPANDNGDPNGEPDVDITLETRDVWVEKVFVY